MRRRKNFKEKPKYYTLRLTPELLELLREKAEEKGITLAFLLEDLIKNYLQEGRNGKAAQF